MTIQPETSMLAPNESPLVLVAGRSNPELAQRMAKRLGVPVTPTTCKTFPNGEVYTRYDASIRGSDIFIVQSVCHPVNDNLMELLLLADAAKLGSARRLTAVIPWFPYARQDKKSAPREPIAARLVARMLKEAGFNRVVSMDLHAGQVQGFFDGPLDHMTALPLFADHFRAQGAVGPGVVVVSPDTGRVKLAKRFAEMLGADLAIIAKDRPAHSVANVIDVIGSVEGKIAIISDDMIDTAGTLCAAAVAVKKAGATKVYACATHPVFSDPALVRIAESALDGVIVGDTLPLPANLPANVRVLRLDALLAETINAIHQNGSVSSIFGGANQIF